ncbi:DUF4160 domain-containing protein [Cognataquiflexum nitidum]|uniref:DUF4160 domain-containing protein n=1 Tax=Cognataquiflexum nitidum TaxID=2922272 RepID=UPI003AB91BFB
MPKIYEYLGIIFFFYSNDHKPIHVHGQKGEFESKAIFILKTRKLLKSRFQISKEKSH